MTNILDHEPIRPRGHSPTTITSASLQRSLFFPFPSSTNCLSLTHFLNKYPNTKKGTMDASTDPQADDDLCPEEKIIRTGKTPSAMPWTTYSTPFGEQTHTQEEEERLDKQTKERLAPRTGVTYKNSKLGNVIFTNEEEEAFYREAASTLPKGRPPSPSPSSSLPLPLCPVQRYL